jgi:LacI family transcriptional regulator
MPKRKRIVTVLLSAVASSIRDTVRGIADQGKAHDWHLSLHLWGQVSEAQIRWIRQGDGVIFEGPQQSSPAKVPQWKVPAVTVQTPHLAERYPLVSTDYCEVGCRAARYLIQKGLTHLAYLSYADNDPAEAGFRDVAEAAGKPVSIYYLGADQPEFDARARRNLVRWFSRLPPPVGLLMRDDFLAQKVIDWIPPEWCPERLAVMGIGNDSIICELTNPTLSSVDRNAREVGHTAADLLHRMMAGESIEPQAVLLNPGQVIERQSTGLRYTPDPLVTRAVRILEENLADSPGTDALCDRLKVSRSTLENRFKTALGHSVFKQRRHIQIEHVKKLLATTREPMSTIAEQCGFANQQRLTEAFRSGTGTTPIAYRRTTHQ